MDIAIVYAGGGATIPHTPFDLGVSFISLWVNGSGFTSGSNDLGTVGYMLLNVTPTEVSASDETVAAFGNLHGRVVRFRITPSKFIRDGGTARFELTIPADGDVAEKSIDFTASNIRGMSITAGSVEFTAEMLQMERSFAEIDDAISEDDTVAIIDAAPVDDENVPA